MNKTTNQKKIKNGLILDLKALHDFMTVYKVLDKLVKCMTQMQMSIRIGGSIMQDKQLSAIVFALPGVQVCGAALTELMFAHGGVGPEGEVGLGEE